LKLRAEQFANSGPSPTDEDAFTTVSHLTDQIGHDSKHGTSHLFSLMEHVQKADIPPKQKKTILWHAAHSEKHFLSVRDHAEKLGKHVARHPAFRESIQEIRHINPMKYGAQ
jgi:hypothetical protein